VNISYDLLVGLCAYIRYDFCKGLLNIMKIDGVGVRFHCQPMVGLVACRAEARMRTHCIVMKRDEARRGETRRDEYPGAILVQ
jgi:hypothetical protein